MAIIKLDNIAENGDKNLTGFDVQQGFIQAEKPARQWFNSLFNSTIKKVNEVITVLEALVINTDKIVDGAVTTTKLANAAVTGDKIAKNAALDTPLLINTYLLTTLDAPNINLAADGTLTRSNDPLNASTRKVGAAAGNLVERGADGYPTNNNAIGVGQTWQDMTASRANAVTYTNSTGRPILISVHYRGTTTNITQLSLDGFVDTVKVILASTFNSQTPATHSVSYIVPANSTYQVVGSTNSTMTLWSELR